MAHPKEVDTTPRYESGKRVGANIFLRGSVLPEPLDGQDSGPQCEASEVVCTKNCTPTPEPLTAASGREQIFPRSKKASIFPDSNAASFWPHVFSAHVHIDEPNSSNYRRGTHAELCAFRARTTVRAPTLMHFAPGSRLMLFVYKCNQGNIPKAFPNLSVLIPRAASPK